MKRTVATGIVALGICSGHTVAAQYRTGTQRVVVDVTVTNNKGEAVRDLTCADFRVTDNGVPQKVATCEFVAAPAAVSNGSAPRADAGSTGRLRPLVVVLDDYNLPLARVQVVRDQLARFIQTAPGPDDIVGLFFAGESASDGRLTVNRQAVAARVGTIESWLVNAAPPRTGEHVLRMAANGADPAIRQRDRARLLLHTLRSVSKAVANDQDFRRARLILISPGFPFAWELRKETIVPELRETVDAVNRSGVTIHAVDPAGMSGVDMALNGAPGEARPAPSARDLLAHDNADVLTMLSVDTGGLLLRNRNDLFEALQKAGADGASHYVLAYDAEPADGRYHTIDVKVTRGRYQVRARRGYVAR